MTIYFKPQSPFSLEGTFYLMIKVGEKLLLQLIESINKLRYTKDYSHKHTKYSVKRVLLLLMLLGNDIFLTIQLIFTWFNNIYLAFCLEIWTSTTLGLSYTLRPSTILWAKQIFYLLPTYYWFNSQTTQCFINFKIKNTQL